MTWQEQHFGLQSLFLKLWCFLPVAELARDSVSAESWQCKGNEKDLAIYSEVTVTLVLSIRCLKLYIP